MGSPKIEVRLENGSKVMVLLNTDVKINLISRKLMEDSNLAMRWGLKLELVSYTGYSRPFWPL